MRKIGIFGGTYNPPHIGHLNIAEEFIKLYVPEKVLIIPTYIPPHKEKAGSVSAAERAELCRRTFKGPFYEICDIEINRKGKSFTADTLRELSGRAPDAEFYFLVGDDMLRTLHTWREPKEILRLCRIVAAVRSDSLTTEDLFAYARQHFPEEYEYGRIQFIYTEPFPLSSTEVRSKAEAGLDIRTLVTPECYEYIKEKGLYENVREP